MVSNRTGCLISLGLLIVFGIMLVAQLSEIQRKDFVEIITNQPVTLYNQEIQVLEDKFLAFPIELEMPSEVTINYLIKSGPNIDVFFVNQTDFDNYESQDEGFNYYSDLSTFGTASSSRTVKMDAGNYYIIFDNTDFGITYPPMNFANDVSTLDLEVTRK